MTLNVAKKDTAEHDVAIPTIDARINYDACPLCASKQIELLTQADCSRSPQYHPALPAIMKWLQCKACNHVFTEGYFTPEALNLVFGTTVEKQKFGYDIERQRIVSARMIQKVARHVPAGYWLDVGFGNGSLLFTADEWGYHAVGVDLRVPNVEGLRNTGFEAHCTDVADLEQPGRYAVVSMADVLEHIPFPKKGLKSAHRLLQPGGALFLSMPNSDSMVWRLLNANNLNPYWSEIEHYHNFGRVRLTALLAECGFQVAEYGISERYRACMEIVALRQP